jgi:class 3 adenylate cyclase/tetratricopeptide (TPR) repeat protein
MRFCLSCGRPRTETGNVPRPDPRAYTPKHLADKILTSRAALEGERKQVTVLFADVKGSMELAEQVDPEEWHKILDRFFQILTDGVHRFEGTVNQYTGDGIMALFGAPIAHEDHAHRACWAALHLQEELRRYTEEMKRTRGVAFAARMGLNSGEVIVGTIGDDLRMDYTAQGHTVGLAQRMEQLADPGKAYLTDHTARLVVGYFRVRDLGEFAVKGVTTPLRVHELEGAGMLRTRLEVSRLRGLTRFVGRDDEVQTLEAALARSLEGHGQVVGVVADAGTGKSRLCFEFIERCRARGIAANEAHAVAHGKAIPFLPILDLFRDYFGITPQDSNQVAREKIAGRMLLLDEGLRDSLPLVFDFLGVTDPSVADPERPVAPMDPEARQRQLFAMVKRLTQARSRRAPAVTLIEDLHWLDGGSAAFLEVLVEATAATRSLLLVNFRPEFHAAWMQQSSYQQLPLVPLGPQAIKELLEDLLGRDASVSGLAATIYARTAGNPFFAEEVVQALIEAGSLQGTRGAYRLMTPVETLVVPPTVQAVLAARIDRLGEREKAVLQTAAVIGKEFSEPVLQRVISDVGAHGCAPSDLTAALAALKRMEFVYEQALYPVAEYAFKHPLTQEVAYHSLLSERRARTHAAVARALETHERGEFGEKAAVIAYHWEGAGDRAQAGRWHARAAKWAEASSSAEAARHWKRVCELLGDADALDLVELALVACASLLSTGAATGLEDAEAAAIFAEGMQLARRFPNAHAESRLVAAHGVYLVFRGAAHDALQSVEEVVQRAGESGDPNLHLGALAALALTHLNLGRLLPALAASDQAVQLFAAAPQGIEPEEAARALSLRGLLLTLAGQLQPAAESFYRAEQLIPAGNDVLIGSHTSNLAYFALQRGEAHAALSHAQRALDYAGRTSSPTIASYAHWVRGEAQNLLGDFEGSLRSFEQALATGAMLNLEGYFVAGLAAAHLGLGDHDRARLTAEHAIEVARQRGHAISECDAQLTLARVLADVEGATAAAAIEAALQEGERLIAATGARIYSPRLHEERARLAGVRGDAAGRERELRAALRLYTEMGATGHAERIESLLH